MRVRSRRPPMTSALIISLTLVVCGGVASADVDPNINSTYDMIFRVIGQSYFKIRKNDEPKSERVEVTLEPTSGEPTLVNMFIEQEDSASCGIFSGCNWRYASVDCLRTVDPAKPNVTCTWAVSVSDERHRLVMSKSDDHKRIIGRVYIRKP